MRTASWPGAAPSWPQLAGWLATPTLQSVTGRWRSTSGGGAWTGTFAYRAPGDWHRTWDDEAQQSGMPAATPLRWARPDPFGSGRERWALAEPVTAVQHDGRLCWRAAVAGMWQDAIVLLVDDDCGLCVAVGDGSGSWSEEVRDLVVDPALPDALFNPAVQARRQEQREQRLHELLHQRPVPAPRWFPWRRSDIDAAGWRNVAARHGGLVTRVRVGQTAPQLPWHPDEELAVEERDGWTYILSGVNQATASAVVDSIVEGRPYDW